MLTSLQPEVPKLGHRETLRAPRNGVSDDGQLGLNFQSNAQMLSTQLWQLLNPTSIDNTTRPWDKFANHYMYKVRRGPNDFWEADTSLESWHDQIHGLVGSGSAGTDGHMGIVSVASVSAKDVLLALLTISTCTVRSGVLAPS